MTAIEVRTEGRTASEVLAWSREVVDPALRAAVDSLPEGIRRVARYHFGWEDADGHPVAANPGKALRPTLVLVAADAVGGSVRQALPAAAAVELVHNFSLLHDDVMDGDETRRHRPAAWTVFGLSAAILTGDALLTLAVDLLAECGHPGTLAGTRLLDEAVQALLEGQLSDTSFERRSDVALAECVDMARGKTAALLGASCALGALFGNGSPAQVERLKHSGAQLGLAFQHVDDLLGIWGDPAVTGKPVYSDLRSRKKSLPVVAALTAGGKESESLGTLYHRKKSLSGTDLVHAAKLIDDAGGRQWSHEQADELLADSLDHLRAAELRARGEAELVALARLATYRDR